MNYILNMSQVKMYLNYNVKTETKNKTLQEIKAIFEKLKTDEKSVLFFEEKHNIKLVKNILKTEIF